MNLPFVAPTGALFCYAWEWVACRWGGGAEAGRTHVFPSGNTLGPLPNSFNIDVSYQCVTDDFGNLVAVA